MSSKGSFRANTAKTPSVRRNLFHHHLSRRPTTTSTSNSCSTTQEPAKDETSEIVARDNKGNYQFRVPALPPLEDDHVPDEEMGHERDSKWSISLVQYMFTNKLGGRIGGQNARGALQGTEPPTE